MAKAATCGVAGVVLTPASSTSARTHAFTVPSHHAAARGEPNWSFSTGGVRKSQASPTDFSNRMKP